MSNEDEISEGAGESERTSKESGRSETCSSWGRVGLDGEGGCVEAADGGRKDQRMSRCQRPLR